MVLEDTSITKFLSATLEGGHKILSTATAPNVIEGHRPNREVLWFGNNTYIFPGSAVHRVTITLQNKFPYVLSFFKYI